MEIHLLDVGTIKYGDCILIRHKEKTILIDGAHPKDSSHILSQLESLTGSSAPVNVDLLIVTHCHSDHIGCLPDLILNNKLTAASALVADEKYGWPSNSSDDILTESQKKLKLLLLEEDHSGLPDEDMRDFIDAVINLEENYKKMLERLKDNGTKLVKYRGPNSSINKIENQFKDVRLKIFGPTLTQLKKCADAIGGDTDALKDALTLSDALSLDELANAYRNAMKNISIDDITADGFGSGAARNNQSIVLKIEAGGWSALLNGDMQFASAGVNGLENSINTLLGTATKNKSYGFVKLSHHTASNGLDVDLLEIFKATGAKLFAHSGGINDADHPNKKALAALKKNKTWLKFARTDHNGLISVTKKGSKLSMIPNKGVLNDFEPNQVSDKELPTLVPVKGPSEETAQSVVKAFTGDYVRVITKIPNEKTKVRLTIEVEPGETSNLDLMPGIEKKKNDDLTIASGRTLPPLLFITNSEILKDHIGADKSDEILNAIRRIPNVRLQEILINDAYEAARSIRNLFSSFTPDGVVLIGGYDVVPPQQLDVIDAKLRKALKDSPDYNKDADDFIVWSDDIYGDVDGDGLPEIPVSRIPDSKSYSLLSAALSASDFSQSTKFGVRNVARPFADSVYTNLPGKQNTIFISEVFGPDNVDKSYQANAIYFMLHGSEHDASNFWGEDQNQEAYLAISVNNLPKAIPGSIIFSGCCWGALSMIPSAARKNARIPFTARMPENSIALNYLQAGAQAFIGCTGSHYSPGSKPYNHFGKPMHDSFWKSIIQGHKPSKALFLAKEEFARSMPHGLDMEPFNIAVELKTFRQFTCLGLGW